MLLNTIKSSIDTMLLALILVNIESIAQVLQHPQQRQSMVLITIKHTMLLNTEYRDTDGLIFCLTLTLKKLFIASLCNIFVYFPSFSHF
jgi:hypothetical protein